MQHPALIIHAHKASKVIIPVDADVIGLDDGTEVHLFDRKSLVHSMRVRSEPALQGHGKVGAIRYRAHYHVRAMFNARHLQSGEVRVVELIFRASCRSRSHNLLREVIARIGSPVASAAQSPQSSTVLGRQGMIRPALRFIRAAALVGVAAYAVSIVYAAAGASGDSVAGFDPDKVKAWSTEQIPSSGVLSNAELETIVQASKTAGLDFSQFEQGPKEQAIPFYVFSRLDCEDCETVEHALPAVDREFAPVILPTDTTATTSATLGAIHAYCSEHPTAAWLTMSVTGQIPPFRAQCDGWQSKVATSQLAHTMSGLNNATPSIIAPNGAVYEGSLAQIPSEERGKAITEWLQANRGATP